MASIEEDAKKLNIGGIFTTAIVSAFSFIAALFWRDAISSTIDAILPSGEGLYYKYLAAILATIIAGVAIYLIYKAEKLKEEKFLKRLQKIKTRSYVKLKKLR